MYKEKKYSNKLHEYHFESGYWYDLVTMPITGNIIGTLIGNHFYAAIWNKNSSSELYSYNVDSGIWSLEFQITITFEIPAISSIDNTIYISENNRIIKFDLNTKSLRRYVINLDLKGASMISTDDALYIIGGLKEN